jgi:hypothetical protein
MLKTQPSLVAALLLLLCDLELIVNVLLVVCYYNALLDCHLHYDHQQRCDVTLTSLCLDAWKCCQARIVVLPTWLCALTSNFL